MLIKLLLNFPKSACYIKQLAAELGKG